MTLLAFNMTRFAYYRVAELAEFVCLIGGLAILADAMKPPDKRMGQAFGGGALVVGFALLLIATRGLRPS